MDVESTLLERLFSVWKNSPNILNIIEFVSDPLQDTADVSDYILAHFSIDTAEGEMLDNLGEIIGVARPPKQEVNIFTLCRKGEVQDPDKSFADTSDPTVTVGGRLTTLTGLVDEDATDPNMSDTDFRYLIRQKASAYRTDMTRRNLFNYLLAFGSRCEIDDDTAHTVAIDPISYYDLNNWAKTYVAEKGFKPAGISIDFRDNLYHESSI